MSTIQKCQYSSPSYQHIYTDASQSVLKAIACIKESRSGKTVGNAPLSVTPSFLELQAKWQSLAAAQQFRKK